jgi:hypothetical protein
LATDRFDSPVVAYPSPASGDTVTLGIKMEEEADEVSVDVYNSGMKRVYQGSWRNVTLADGGVVITGVSKWAPGVYWVKVRMKNASGKEAALDSVKLVVKR